MKLRVIRALRPYLSLAAGLLLVVALGACRGVCGCGPRHRSKLRPHSVRMEVTAYSSDPKSTGWELNKQGVPVYAYGPNKGKPKAVGITADGTKAKRGTLAADTDHYPFGTRIYVPGYGWGTVHDRGSAIKGPGRLDVYFPTRKQALQWGRQNLTVKVRPANP